VARELSGAALLCGGDVGTEGAPDTRRAVASTVVCALGLVLAGCAPRPEGATTDRAPRRVAIVITVDSLRASRLGAYGYPRPTTPSLDRFADQAVRFSRAYSSSSWTKPAMASLFLARPVHEHLAVLSLRRVDDALTFAADLDWDQEKKERTLGRGMVVPGHLEPFHARLEGFEKGAFLNNPHLAADFGFDRSWDQYRLYPPKRPRRGRSRVDEIHQDVLRFLDERGTQDVYLWIHHNDVHHPYGPVRKQAEVLGGEFSEDEFRLLSRAEHEALIGQAEGDPRRRRLLSALYDAGLRQFDAGLGRFFDALRSRGVFDEALIIVTADHGEEFGEHGAFGHGQNLFAPTTAVPFLLKLPGQHDGRLVDVPVSLIDVGPTVLDFAGGLPSGPLPGRSLLPVVQGRREPQRSILIELVHEGYEVALLRASWKLRLVFDGPSLFAHVEGRAGGPLEPRLVQLYDLARDPDEERPLVLSEHEALVAQLREELYASLGGRLNFLARLEEEAASTDYATYPELLEKQRGPRFRELEAQLQALGYL
jgi:arylsulfatase